MKTILISITAILFVAGSACKKIEDNDSASKDVESLNQGKQSTSEDVTQDCTGRLEKETDAKQAAEDIWKKLPPKVSAMADFDNNYKFLSEADLKKKCQALVQGSDYSAAEKAKRQKGLLDGQLGGGCFEVVAAENAVEKAKLIEDDAGSQSTDSEEQEGGYNLTIYLLDDVKTIHQGFLVTSLYAFDHLASAGLYIGEEKKADYLRSRKEMAQAYLDKLLENKEIEGSLEQAKSAIGALVDTFVDEPQEDENKNLEALKASSDFESFVFAQAGDAYYCRGDLTRPQLEQGYPGVFKVMKEEMDAKHLGD